MNGGDIFIQTRVNDSVVEHTIAWRNCLRSGYVACTLINETSKG